LYKDELKEIYLANDLEHINMLIGIFEDAYINDDFTNVDLIIKELNPRIFKFIKNKTVIDIDEFVNREFFSNKIRKKVGTGKYFDENFSEEEICNNTTALVYVAIRLKIKFYGEYIEKTYEHYQMLVNSFLQSMRFKYYGDSIEIKENIIKLKEKLNITDEFINRQENVGTFLDNYIEYEIENEFALKYGTEKFDDVQFFYPKYKSFRDYLFTQKKLRYIGVLTIFTPLFGIEANVFLNKVPINTEVVDKILYSCIGAIESNKVPESELNILFAAELYLYALIEEYNQLKYKYLNSEKDKYFDDITALKENLEIKYKELEEKENELILRATEAEEKYKSVEEQIKNQSGEIRRLSKLVEKQEKIIEQSEEKITNKDYEIEILKSIIENQKNEVISISLEAQVNYLKNKKIAIFGGNKSSIKQLNDLLNNIVVFEVNTKDISSVNNCDVIFINYQWMKHSLFYKIDSLKNKTKTPIFYISGTNVKQIIGQMYQCIKNS